MYKVFAAIVSAMDTAKNSVSSFCVVMLKYSNMLLATGEAPMELGRMITVINGNTSPMPVISSMAVATPPIKFKKTADFLRTISSRRKCHACGEMDRKFNVTP